MQQLQGTFLAKEQNKVTFATADGQVKYGYVSGDCTLISGQGYYFALDTKTSKAGKSYTVITGITDTAGKAVTITSKAKGQWTGRGGSKYDSDGMARGNCRAVTTEYIVACLAKGIQPDIPAFVALLKQSENLMLAKTMTVPAATASPLTATQVNAFLTPPAQTEPQVNQSAPLI